MNLCTGYGYYKFAYTLSELRVGLLSTLPLFKYSPILCGLTDGCGCSLRENISQQVTPNAHYM